MKVVMISKALVVGAYQAKLVEIARHPDVELTCIVPPSWRQDGQALVLERAYTEGYDLVVEPIRWNGNFHVFYFPGLGTQLRRLRPDVVHVDEEPYNLATFLATRAALGVGARPLFFTWQNLYRRYPAPFRWFESYVFSRAEYAIAGNAEAVEVVRRKGYRGPTTVIPQFGVDATQFSPRPELRRAREAEVDLRIGYLGRLVEEKGLVVLLEALVGLRGSWRLDLFGHGPHQPALQARVAELGLGDRVRFCDRVPSTEVPGRLQGLDVLVLPSLTRPNWKEQFGRALVEAMACGVPVVGSESGEIPNVIGEAGLHFPEGDAAELRRCLTELMTSPQRRAELSARGRVRVLERFTHEKIAAATCAVYRQVMATSARASV